MSSGITILVQEKRWQGSQATLRKAAQAAIAAERKRNIALTLVLANDRKVKKLNALYRGKDRPTNVLSFPDGHKEGKVTHIGDVVLAYETIVREAKQQGKTFRHHATHMAVHGTMHLLGYDHEKESDAEEMESREVKILHGLKVANPYA